MLGKVKNFLAKYTRLRKAIVAGLSPLVALPFGTWALHAVDSDIPVLEPFSFSTIIAALGVGLQIGFATYFTKNAA